MVKILWVYNNFGETQPYKELFIKTESIIYQKDKNKFKKKKECSKWIKKSIDQRGHI